MADNSALTKVMQALLDLLSPQSGITWFMDRDESAPIQEDELPAGAINCIDIDLNERQETGHGLCYWWDVTLQLDFTQNFEATSITAWHREKITEAVALINANWSLGGKLQELNIAGISRAEDALADLGSAVLEMNVKFMTQFDDWTVGIGQAGPF